MPENMEKMVDDIAIPEESFAIQSAYRLAYTHMNIEVDEECCISELDYSTYQSTGDGYGDLFSRPVLYSDRKDEAMDMLLYIYDKYTDEEIESFAQ